MPISSFIGGVVHALTGFGLGFQVPVVVEVGGL